MTDGVCVVGLGYVGVPLALAFDAAGENVVGYDIDEGKVDALASGRDPTGDVGERSLAECDVRFTADPAGIGEAEYVVVTVPTPVDDLQKPDLDNVRQAGRTVGRYLREGATVVLESTVYPGATKKVLQPAIEATSGYTAGEEFAVGYSPERISPGEDGRGLSDVTKVVGARSDEVTEDLADLYEQVVDCGVYRTPNVETAEAAKAIENVQRDINLALVNELSMACDHMDLDTSEVLAAASTKWNFHDEYSPGLVGGHCIPVDPFYLVYRSENDGYSPKLILQAREINEYMPTHAADLVIRGLNDAGKVLKESEVLVLGLAYKASVGEIRTSAVDGVIAELASYDVSVTGYDPHADVTEARQFFDADVQEEVSLDGFDAVVVATDHEEFRELDLADAADRLADDPVLVDLPGTFDRETATDHGFAYDRL